MYLKLAFRNAKRSAVDYLLYILTMIILVSIIHIANCIAAFGSMQAGFQTLSLPLLIGVVMAILMNYIKTFMIKQRAKEFATYILLGMEKKKLSLLFILEVCVIGIVCFLIGILIGTGIYLVCLLPVAGAVKNHFFLIAKSVLQTFLYFCIVELVSAICMQHKIRCIQISELLKEKTRNQKISEKGKTLWGIIFGSSVLSFVALLIVIVSSSGDMANIVISFIAVPLLLSIISFYKWLYAIFSSKRINKSALLYQGLTIYNIAEMTAGTKMSATINSIFCICLLFSSLSFVCGILFLNKNIAIFSPKDQQWMGFLQISQCIIFIVIYFFIISLLQIVEWKRQAKNIKILHYIGKSKMELKSLIKTQTLVKLFMPTSMCFALLVTGVPFVNYKMNGILPAIMQDEILRAVGLFAVCFATLYLCYFLLVYSVSKHYINSSIRLFNSLDDTRSTHTPKT